MPRGSNDQTPPRRDQRDHQALAHPPIRVLVVDNDPGMTRTLGINLRTRGYQVDTAGTGAAALTQAFHQPPTLIILDLELPDLDGIRVLTTLAAARAAPIIVTTARDGPHDYADAINAGASAFLVKPFGMDQLLREVQQSLPP